MVGYALRTLPGSLVCNAYPTQILFQLLSKAGFLGGDLNSYIEAVLLGFVPQPQPTLDQLDVDISMCRIKKPSMDNERSD